MQREHEVEVLTYADHLSCSHPLGPEQVEVGATLLHEALHMTCLLAEMPSPTRAPEVALTHQLLISMKGLHPQLEVHQYETSREKQTGADWEWWIEGRNRWFHLLIQAKRLRWFSRQLGYELGHRVGRGGVHKQVDRLVRESLRRGIPALYVLYNPPGKSEDYCTTDCLAVSECLPRNAHGISALSAETAQRLVQNQDRRGRAVVDVPLDEVAIEAVPWTCLIGCLEGCDTGLPAWGSRSPLYGHPAMLWQTLGFDGAYDAGDPAFRFASLAMNLAAFPGAEPPDEVLIERVRRGVRTEPPAYVREPSQETLTRYADDLEAPPAYLVITRRSRG